MGRGDGGPPPTRRPSGIGAFADDTKIVVDGTTDTDGFEGATSSWTVGGPPEGSPPNQGSWQISENLVNAFGAVSTETRCSLASTWSSCPTTCPERTCSTVCRQA